MLQWTVVGLVAASGLLWAEEPAKSGSRVVDVRVEGLHTVAQDACLARVQTKPGVPYTETILNEDIRRLYALGYFTDVQVRSETQMGGMAVVFMVREKPSLSAIELEGPRRLGQEKVLQLLGVSVGELYDPRKLKDGIEQIKAEYRRKGYHQAGVATSMEVNESANTATLYVVVDEGPHMRIKDILVEGNLAFPDGRIRRLMKTKRRHWFASGVYDEQVLEEDLERLRAFYRAHGYQDVSVAQRVVVDPSNRWLYAHLTLTEGRQHRVGQVDVAGTVLFPEHELTALLKLKPGAVFSQETLQEDLRAVKQYYGDRGYINAQVVPETRLDDAAKQVEVTLRIVEHELAYIHRIEIRGNHRTKDVVVRRALRVYPGDAFDGAKIRRSVERLYNLGYFEEVNVETEPTDAASHENLIINVKEAKTGSFSFGGGFSSVDRLVGLVEIEQRNFDWRNWPTLTGAGQDLRFRIEAGSVRRNFDLSFTEPWIFAHPVSFGIDAFSRTRLQSRDLGFGFEEQRQGAGVRLGKELTDTLRADWDYTLFRTEISDVAAEASADLKAEEGRSDISVTGLGFSWDTRDNRFDPSKGAFAFISSNLAGGLLAGDRDFFRVQGGVSWYWPHWDRFVFESRLRSGIVNEYGDTAEVPIFERFFAGGANTIRGFRERRVGPRDPTSNDPIGGEAMLIGTLEEVMTVVNDERGKPILKGAAFIDSGNVWRRIDEYASSVETGVGVGLRVTTPIGPVRVDVGFPISQLGDEKRRPRFHFNVSRSF